MKKKKKKKKNINVWVNRKRYIKISCQQNANFSSFLLHMQYADYRKKWPLSDCMDAHEIWVFSSCFGSFFSGCLKLYGYTSMFFTNFNKHSNFWDFLFASLDNKNNNAILGEKIQPFKSWHPLKWRTKWKWQSYTPWKQTHSLIIPAFFSNYYH